MDFPTRAHLKLKRHNFHQKQKEIGQRTELVTVIPGAICPCCAWQCSNWHHKPEGTARNANPPPEEGVWAVWRGQGSLPAVSWLLPSVQVTRCLHPLPKSTGIRGQGPANPADGRAAEAPGSRAGRREYPYNGGFRTEG